MNIMKKRNEFKRLVTLLLVFVFTVSLFTGCSAAPESERAVEPAPPSAVEEQMDWEMDEAEALSDDFFSAVVEESEVMLDSEDWVAVEVAPISEGNMGPIPIILASETGRQLIYTTDITIETTNFMADMRLLLNKIAQLNGYSERVIVNGRHLINPYVERDAAFIFRLPPENLVEFIIFIEDNYNLVHLDKRMTDLTIAYEQNLAQLDELIDREERLLAELEEEQTTRDQRDLERDLESIQSDIRNLEATTAQIDHDVLYSDITIFLAEVILPSELEPVELPTFGQRFQDTVINSLETILAMLQGFLLFLIAATPWLLPIIAVALLVIHIVKRINKSEKKNAEVARQQVKTSETASLEDNSKTSEAHDDKGNGNPSK
jgi:hypothetical protein